jgi:hypothetical protein
MANFPTSLPSATNPSAGDYLNSPAHATQHGTANDEIAALGAKVGINGSTVITSHDYKLTPRIITNTDGATVTFDLSTRGVHAVTLGGNRTLALSNETVGQVFIIRLIQDGTGTRTVTWFSTIKWPGAVTPTLTTTASKEDVFGFIVTSAGNYDGFVIGQNL